MTTPLHVIHARGNLKGGVDSPLGYRTLIVGPNGSGKSAIQNTVELALTGRVSDIAGRTDASDTSIVGLMAPEGEGLNGNVTLSDSRVLGYAAARKGDGWSRPTTDGDRPSVSFPVQAVRENLTGSADRARRFLLANIGATVSRAEVLRLLPSELRPAYEILAGTKTGTEVDRLLAVLEAAKARVRTAKQEAEAAEATKARMSANLLPEPLDSDLRDAEEEDKKFRDFQPSNNRARLTDEHTRLMGSITRSVKALEAALDEVASVRATLTSLNAPDVHPVTSHILGVLRECDTFPACLICGGPWDAQAETHAHALRADIEAVIPAIATKESLTTRLGLLEAEAAKIRDLVGRDLDAVDALEAQIAALPDDAAFDAAAAQAAAERLATLRQTKASWNSVRGLRETVWTLQKEGKEVKEMFEACTSAVKDLLDLALGKFNTRVQSFLPEGDVFFLRVRDGEREVCQYGFFRNGKHHTALSGAEWARITLALGCAIGGSADLAVFTPEERAFDPNTLRSVMVALSEAPGQVILTSPVRPAGRTPKGWTIIDRTPNTNTPTETA